MGYYIKHVIDVDILTTSIEINIKEQIKEYREQRKEYDIYYRELNKDMLKEKAKEYREVNKDELSTKLKLDRITCECGCTCA